ncbi:hypothetical protein D3C87_102730 [compost metagenome]
MKTVFKILSVALLLTSLNTHAAFEEVRGDQTPYREAVREQLERQGLYCTKSAYFDWVKTVVRNISVAQVIYVDMNSATPVLRFVGEAQGLKKERMVIDIFTQADQKRIREITVQWAEEEQRVNKGSLAKPQFGRQFVVKRTAICQPRVP